LNDNNETSRKYQEGLFTAISAGFFLLLVGTLFVITPNLSDNILNFFESLEMVDVPNTDVVFLGPQLPQSHLPLYQTVGQFSIVWAIFQIIILVLRFVIPSSWNKKSETVSNFVYWIGAAVLIQLFLVESTPWFIFWSTIIIITGVSLIARAVVIAVSRI